MTKKQEKFLAGVFGTLLLAAIAVAFGGLTFWLFDHVGPLTSITCLIIAIALFAGFMNASTPDKKEESNEP
ncbi:hypothetical protein [Mesorhizobium sp. M4B.F.Ca.ET.058.02.1.1]|uniref:hypothetical protein n=1 Tax=Mesorhizobium sp. M4B.F.Ca.ET.058.02.1.1 TaxID=2493675 RepID=UPI000F75B3E3|nr:hypothetical protein [Mesorhizobium sp. M4B.F.Ca.ET.058.02.1.1]AZO48073.1 hypothetical protein EJ073_09770 [Mesorhizobium sp. M4B.F.Ca.ET.058.02.1.1]TJX71213.1 MAG: hypothetical protein E5W21_07710 [Mesorhizobium sp.]